MSIIFNQITKQDINNILEITSKKKIISLTYNRKIWNIKNVEDFVNKNLEEQKIKDRDRDNFYYTVRIDKQFIGIVGFIKMLDYKRYFLRLLLYNDIYIKNILIYLIKEFNKKKPYEKKLYVWINKKNKKIIQYCDEQFQYIRDLKLENKEIKEYIIHFNFNKLLKDFPYYKFYITDKEILLNFLKLKKKYIPQKIDKLVEGSILSFEENYFKNENINRITDFFSEICRVKCNFNKNISPYKFYEMNRELFKKDMSYRELDTILYKNTKFCSNFNITIVYTVLNYFKPKSMLDFSSGWGDRLIGAMAYGCSYQGIDPSDCLHQIYPSIIKFFGYSEKKYNVIKDGFENVNLGNKQYDIVFTSPPFFDLEVYQTNETQSINKFNSLKKWKSNFLFPSLNKSLNHLNKNGHIAIYISDYGNIKYTRDMKNYLNKKKNCKYIGTMNWINVDSSKNIRNIYIWKKI